jgi:hypothetical protein
MFDSEPVDPDDAPFATVNFNYGSKGNAAPYYLVVYSVLTFTSMLDSSAHHSTYTQSHSPRRETYGYLVLRRSIRTRETPAGKL